MMMVGGSELHPLFEQICSLTLAFLATFIVVNYTLCVASLLRSRSLPQQLLLFPRPRHCCCRRPMGESLADWWLDANGTCALVICGRSRRLSPTAFSSDHPLRWGTAEKCISILHSSSTTALSAWGLWQGWSPEGVPSHQLSPASFQYDAPNSEILVRAYCRVGGRVKVHTSRQAGPHELARCGCCRRLPHPRSRTCTVVAVWM
jgi:hypothetical protein